MLQLLYRHSEESVVKPPRLDPLPHGVTCRNRPSSPLTWEAGHSDEAPRSGTLGLSQEEQRLRTKGGGRRDQRPPTPVFDLHMEQDCLRVRAVGCVSRLCGGWHPNVTCPSAGRLCRCGGHSWRLCAWRSRPEGGCVLSVCVQWFPCPPCRQPSQIKARSIQRVLYLAVSDCLWSGWTVPWVSGTDVKLEKDVSQSAPHCFSCLLLWQWTRQWADRLWRQDQCVTSHMWSPEVATALTLHELFNLLETMSLP